LEDKRLGLKRRLIELEHEAESISSRVRDIEWQMVNYSDSYERDNMADDRRKAMDKLKHVRNNIAEIKIRLLEE